MKRTILFLALLLSSLGAFAQNYNFSAVTPAGQTLYYKFWGDGVAVTSHSSTEPYNNMVDAMGTLEIPSSVNYEGTDYSVVHIDSYAFRGCALLSSVTIPTSVTSIAMGVFSGCSNLTSVTIPNSVTTIGNYAFEYCSGLTSVTIPNTVTTIGYGVFYGCSGLTSVTIPNSVTSIGGSAFSGCSGLTGVTIPNSVTTIGERAFNNCSGLTSVTIPNSVTSIGSGAFYGCSGLTSVTIGNSVVSIGSYAFEGCRGLTNVTIPNSVLIIGQSAFVGCSVRGFVIPNTVLFIGNNAFSNCRYVSYCGTATGSPWGAKYAGCCYQECDIIYTDSTKTNLLAYVGNGGSITIPNSVETIDYHAFIGCGNVDTLYYNACNLSSANLSSMPSAGFRAMKIKHLIIGDGVQSLPSYVFSGQDSLTSLNIPNTMTSIGQSAFDGCSGLTCVTIGESVTSIGKSAFDGCSNVDTLYYNARDLTTSSYWHASSMFDDSYNSYGFRPMKLKHLVIGDGVQVLPEGGFFQQDSLTSINIPNSVTSISTHAFQYCRGLMDVTIPNSVTSIGNYAFSSCNHLTSVNIPNSVTDIYGNAFSYCSNLSSVTLPNSLTYIGWEVFSDCNSLTNITIPNSVTTIGSYPFRGCRNLASISVDSENTHYDSRDNCNAIIESSTNKLITGCKNTIIPNTVTTIGDYAFYCCDSLTSVTIGKDVNAIGSSAFQGCTSLRTVYNLSALSFFRHLSEDGYVAYWAKNLIQGNEITVYDGAQASIGSHSQTSKNAIIKVDGSYTVVDDDTPNPTDTQIRKKDVPTNFVINNNGNPYASKIVLTDGNEPYYSPVAFRADAVEYKRDYTADNRTTLCLPFALANEDLPEDVTVYNYSDYNSEDAIISFSEIGEDSLYAYTPYMVEYSPSKTIVNWTATKGDGDGIYFPATPNSMDTTINGGSFIGTMTRTCMNGSNYGYKNGYFVQSAEGNDASDHTSHAHVNPFRAYFEITTPSGSQGFAMPTELAVRFNTAEDNVGIDSVEAQQSNIRYSNDVYDMMGRMVRKNAENLDGLRKGVYIWKGEKKVVF